jgi:hypothetical protein
VQDTHIFNQKFVLTREMTAPENSHRAVAIANLYHIVYHVLWHLRVKFPKVTCKGKKEKMTTRAPDEVNSAGALREIGIDLKDAIRRLASARRTKLMNIELQERSIKEEDQNVLEHSTQNEDLTCRTSRKTPPTSESKNYVQFALVIFRIVGVSTLLDR